MSSNTLFEQPLFEFATSDLSAWRGKFIYCPHPVILHCISGSASLSINMEPHHISTGSLLWLPQPDVISLTHASSDFQVQMVTFSAQTAYTPEPKHASITGTELQSLTSSLFSALSGHTCIATLCETYIAGILQSLLVVVANAPHSAATTESTATERYYAAFIHLLRQNVRSQHEVKFYAAALSITPKYLNEIIQRKVKCTAKDLISRFLAAQIQHDLNNPALTAKDLAVKYQFSDQSSLGKFFKKETGLSPQNYRDTLTKQ